MGEDWAVFGAALAGLLLILFACPYTDWRGRRIRLGARLVHKITRRNQ